MGSKIEYVDAGQAAASAYVRNSKAVAALWGIFSVCYAVICCVVLTSGEWVGGAGGRGGVWQTCAPGDTCSSRVSDPWSLSGGVLGITALSAGLACLTLLVMVFFCFCRSTTVFYICGYLHLLSGVCLIVGVSLFPATWGETDTREVCGVNADKYKLGECGVRWGYALACVACLDAVVLSILAFLLAARHIRLHADLYTPSVYTGEHNNGFVCDAASRKTAAHTQHDAYSQYSRTVPQSLHHYRL